MAFSRFALCNLLTAPVRWLPQPVHAGGLSLVLNHLLAHALADGELDFLIGKVVSLEVTDLGVRCQLRRGEEGFVTATSDTADVSFSGDAYTLLLLATQREDADSLFFQRRLRISGDTATGLHLKNFLDAFGQPPLPGPARQALEKMADLYASHCQKAAGLQGAQFNPGRPFQ